MNINDFKRALVAFADDVADIDIGRGRVVLHIRDELIDVGVQEVSGDLFVIENGERSRAFDWLIQRIAKLPLLADRILANVRPQEHFITPSGQLRDQLGARPQDIDIPVADIAGAVSEVLSRGTPDTSTVLYVTSDAGEGKTTLINELARRQAERYRAKQSSWLLVPISLGGRSFLTFDDVVVAELVNRLRFQLLYYQAFLELVRLRVIVPAFDGFEEMFVEGSSGEALSALGNLMHDLESSGTVLIAARKAYFEYQNIGTQAKLFDAIGSNAVDFARISLDRWDRGRFEQYATMRGLPNASVVYDKVCTRLEPGHPLLTRAVLVERLVDVALDEGVDGLLDHLGTTPEDYFYQFVNRLIEREANEKWIDRSGTPHVSLLSTDEHHSLLAFVAREMWTAGSEVLRADYMDLLAELFASERNKSPQLSRQIVNRLKQHSLIVAEPGRGGTYSFDHEDFRTFYLGLACGHVLLDGESKEIGAFLQRGTMPSSSVDAAINTVRRNGGDLVRVTAVLQGIADTSAPTSYASENVAALALRALELLDDASSVTIRGLLFGKDALKGRRFGKVTFLKCYFQDTSLDEARLGGCTFSECDFQAIEWSVPLPGAGSVLSSCAVRSVHPDSDGGAPEFDPRRIVDLLAGAGFSVQPSGVAPRSSGGEVEPDEDTVLAEHALRIFMRATQINEDVFRQKFGTRAGPFFERVLPHMLAMGVLEEVAYKGAGRQRRFKLCVPMRNIDAAVPARVTTVNAFLRQVLSAS